MYRSDKNRGDHRLAKLDGEPSEVAIKAEVGNEILADLPRVDVIKCDVQGSEAKVFAGLRKLLGRSTPKPIMIVEFEPFGLANMGSEPGALLDLFDAWGYSYSFVNWENIFPISRQALVELAKHWIMLKSPGNLDLILAPS